MPTNDGSIEIDGRALAFREVGEGPPLVLVNGYAATGSDWDPGFVEGLAAERTVLMPDNRGTGGSELGEPSFSMADLAADVLALMDERGIGAAPVVGWSMGGAIVQELASRAPRRVSALVLLATDRGGSDAVLADEETWTSLGDYSGPPDQQARRLLGLIFPPTVADRLYDEVGPLVADARVALSHDALDAQIAALNHWHDRRDAPELGPIECPLMVACGTEDRVIPPENALRLAELSASSWLMRFPGGGHAFMAQFPRRLAAAINLFLVTVASGDA